MAYNILDNGDFETLEEMKNFYNHWMEEVAKPTRTIDTQVVIHTSNSDIALDTNDIVSYKIVYQSTSGQSFIPGSFPSSTLELSLIKHGPVASTINFKTLKIQYIVVKAGILVDGVMRYMRMGKFYVNDKGIIEDETGKVSISASAIPSILSDTFRSEALTFPCTIQEMISAISSMVGINIYADEDFVNLSLKLDETFVLTATYRETLMYIAEALGAQATMDYDGEIRLIPMYESQVVDFVIDENYWFSLSQQDGTVKPFQYINIKAEKDDLGVSKTIPGVNTECEYNLINNPLTYGHPQDFLDGLNVAMIFPEFHPTKLSMQGRPEWASGMTVKYSYKGTEYLMPVCSHTFEYNGGFKSTIESVGSNELKVSSLDTDLKSQISALRQNMNVFKRDLNSTESRIVEVEGLKTKVSDLVQTAESLKSKVSSLEGDDEKYTEIKQTANQLTIEVGNVSKDLEDTKNSLDEELKIIKSYFDFTEDGLIIGKSSSPVKLLLANEVISFLQNDNVLASFSTGNLNVTDATILNRLTLGELEIVPRGNGNVSIKKRSVTS